MEFRKLRRVVKFRNSRIWRSSASIMAQSGFNTANHLGKFLLTKKLKNVDFDTTIIAKLFILQSLQNFS